MFKSFALLAFAGAASARFHENEMAAPARRPMQQVNAAPARAPAMQQARAPARAPAMQQAHAPARAPVRQSKRSIGGKNVQNRVVSEGEQPYSTSYNSPAKTSCHIAPYRPDKIKRARLGTAKRENQQYRSVNWGREGCYSSWQDIDVLDQPAAYEKPSYTQTLISPDQIYNTYDKTQDYTEYGGYGGVRRRSEGINYNKRVYKQTDCNGLRKDTLSTEYIHTDNPSSACVTQYVEPKPWQCYEAPVDYRKVKGVKGVQKTGYDDPLEYPTYSSKSYEYEKPVYQNYEVTKTCKHNPEYVDYEAPHYNFYEYDVKPQEKILPTYYKAPYVSGEESYGYVPESYDYEQKEYPVGYGGHYDDYEAKPMKVLPRYPKEQVQTYNHQVVQETKLQPSRWESEPAQHKLVPDYEPAVYHKPKYAPERPKKAGYGTDLYEAKYAPKTQERYAEQKYAKPAYKAVETNYYPTVTPAPYDYSKSYGCSSCGY